MGKDKYNQPSTWPYTGGVSIFDGTTWRHFTPNNSPLAHWQVVVVEFDANGNLWASPYSEGAVQIMLGNAPTPTPTPTASPTSTPTMTPTPTPTATASPTSRPHSTPRPRSTPWPRPQTFFRSNEPSPHVALAETNNSSGSLFGASSATKQLALPRVAACFS